MRGEYDGSCSEHWCASGSPPHAWGILFGGKVSALVGRFTPTCVGNTSHSLVLPHPSSVHPHMRGEYLIAASSFWTVSGSPPHAWGILEIRLAVVLCQRFTPTCVGNTSGGGCGWTEPAVHPHMRGEYAIPSEWPRYFGMDGSPPHAWGIHPLQRILLGQDRFTPTCVGNTGMSQAFISAYPVHPHMRGEYVNDDSQE